MLALILQPFVRYMIDGACPAFHIDKAAAGSGAGYMANVVYAIVQGSMAIAQTMSERNEEFRKAITATLQDGAPIIFVDNINSHVDSGDLAAALTAGVWRDRILGQTQVTTIPMVSTWIMAGNNVSFSHELMRRLVPIRIDAAVPDPAQDRTAKDFKHYPLQDWLLTNRSQLIWACHVVVKNWVQQGMKPGTKMINSFDGWSRVMSGIMDAAGIDGFLDNVPDYLASKDDELADTVVVVNKLLSKVGTTKFSGTDAYERLLNLDRKFDHFPLGGKDETGQAMAFGKWLNKHVVGATFRVLPETQVGGAADFPKEVRCVKRTLNGKNFYMFCRVK
jgi:hypothetical protein